MKKGVATIVQSAVCRTNARHRPAPSKFYFPGLSTSPTFNSQLFPVSILLQNNFESIRNEYNKIKKGSSNKSDYKEHDLHTGGWDWNSYMLKGKRDSTFASMCPTTVEILESMDTPRLMTDTPFGFAFFSTMHEQSSIAAHNGPCNLRIRCHFPLIVPEGDCGMQVGDEVVRWEVGKPLFFDDCYEHKGTPPAVTLLSRFI